MSPRADNATDPGLETRSTGPLYDRALGLPTRLWGPADVPSQALRIGACIDTAVARSAASFASIDAPPIRESTLGREATTGVGLSTGPGPPAASPPGKKTVRASRRGTWTIRCPGHPAEATSADHEADAVERRVITDRQEEGVEPGWYPFVPAIFPAMFFCLSDGLYLPTQLRERHRDRQGVKSNLAVLNLIVVSIHILVFKDKKEIQAFPRWTCARGKSLKNRHRHI